MGLIGKTFAIILFPLSIIVLLETIGIVALPFQNKVMLGAVLMIGLHLTTLVMLQISKHGVRFMNIATAFIFIAVALAALFSSFLPAFQKEILIIFSVTMFVEGLYALH